MSDTAPPTLVNDFASGAASSASANGVASIPTGLSSIAARVAAVLAARGAIFFVEIVQESGLLRVQVEEALGELVARGRVTADSFNGLRALVTPQRRRTGFHGRSRHRSVGRGFDAAGRWTLLQLNSTHDSLDRPTDTIKDTLPPETVEHAAHSFLQRYGVVCRALLAREALAPSWRELLQIYRRLEARGEIRGGRFVSMLGGEQFALPEAVSKLRTVRRETDDAKCLVLSAADPANLAHLAGGTRVPAVATRQIIFRGGVPIAVRAGGSIEWLTSVNDADQRSVLALFAEPVHLGARRAFGR